MGNILELANCCDARSHEPSTPAEPSEKNHERVAAAQKAETDEVGGDSTTSRVTAPGNSSSTVQKVGVGLMFKRAVTQGNRHWVVQTVIKDSPAAACGKILPGDIFLRHDTRYSYVLQEYRKNTRSS